MKFDIQYSTTVINNFYFHRLTDVTMGKHLFIQFKKNFDQVEQSNWYYEGKTDDKIYEASVEHIAEQMQLEKKEFLKRKIEELGFKEEKDYDGKVVLKSNLPVKRYMAFK